MSLRVRFIIVLLIALAGSGLSLAQSDQSKDKTKVRLSLSFTHDMDKGLILTAKARTKVDKSYEPVKGITVYFYTNEIMPDYQLGKSSTDDRGEAKLTIGLDSSRRDTTVWTDYFATVENDENYHDTETDIRIKTAMLHMELVVTDESEHLVKVNLSEMDSSLAPAPVADVGVRIFVKRMFGFLAINGTYDVTDETGELLVPFPDDIKGDINGLVEIIARIDDNDDYGTLIAREEQNWGIPLTVDPNLQKSHLWSARSNVPVYLLIICNALIVGIWGTIIYLIIQISKIKRLGFGATEAT